MQAVLSQREARKKATSLSSRNPSWRNERLKTAEPNSVLDRSRNSWVALIQWASSQPLRQSARRGRMLFCNPVLFLKRLVL